MTLSAATKAEIAQWAADDVACEVLAAADAGCWPSDADARSLRVRAIARRRVDCAGARLGGHAWGGASERTVSAIVRAAVRIGRRALAADRDALRGRDNYRSARSLAGRRQ